jgi:GTP cyclohydrolase III
VDENEAMEVLTRNGDKVTIHLDVNKRASALNQASRALTAAVDIERKSLNLDRKDGISFGGGSITIVSNVPEPLPLPPGI